MGRKIEGEKFLYCNLEMGCLKILHSDQKSALSKSWKIFVGGVEKSASGEKNRINYYPGGSLQPGRNFSSPSYRYGYNSGSEKDDEISGAGNHFTTFFREGDTRLMRWWSTDSKESLLPWQSPYSYMDNNPILHNDPLGDWVKVRMKRRARKNNGVERLTKMFKQRYNLDVEFTKRKVLGITFGYKLQLKEGQKPATTVGARGDWSKVLLRNKKTKQGLIVDYGAEYDGGVSYVGKSGMIDLADFDENNIIDVPNNDVSKLPFQAQDDQFSLRSTLEHEYLYHAVEGLYDHDKKNGVDWEDPQDGRTNTSIGRVNRNRIIERGSGTFTRGGAFIRKNYRAPSQNGGVTTVGRAGSGQENQDVNVKYRNPAGDEKGVN